ncbi:MAG: glycosyltransferase [Negativicutes bacterium]|nr:glycosyltransferase [Negativicutes bacterium]
MNHDVTVAVCVKNHARDLEHCLPAVRAAGPAELIVVDGCSTDDSRAVAGRYADRVLDDGGRGLAAARCLAVKEAKCSHVLLLGPDFLLPGDFLADMLAAAAQWRQYAGISSQVRVFRPRTIWDRGLDGWWQFQRQCGEKQVIGTPCLFDSAFLRRHNFADSNIAADDTELCLRLTRLGYRLAVVPVVAYDQPGKSWADIRDKFLAYGRADGQFYRLNAASWRWQRRLLSWLYPWRQGLAGLKWAIARRLVWAGLFMLIYAGLRSYGMAADIWRTRGLRG